MCIEHETAYEKHSVPGCPACSKRKSLEKRKAGTPSEQPPNTTGSHRKTKWKWSEKQKSERYAQRILYYPSDTRAQGKAGTRAQGRVEREDEERDSAGVGAGLQDEARKCSGRIRLICGMVPRQVYQMTKLLHCCLLGAGFLFFAIIRGTTTLEGRREATKSQPERLGELAYFPAGRTLSALQWRIAYGHSRVLVLHST